MAAKKKETFDFLKKTPLKNLTKQQLLLGSALLITTILLLTSVADEEVTEGVNETNISCVNDSDCNDSKLCTDDYCRGGYCFFANISNTDSDCDCGTDMCYCSNGTCKEKNETTTGEGIDTGGVSCVNNSDCNDSNPCTSDYCSAGSCVHYNKSNWLSNCSCGGDVCACVNGTCTGTCGDGECQLWESSEKCSADCTEPACTYNSDCDDNNPCTSDVCTDGFCYLVEFDNGQRLGCNSMNDCEGDVCACVNGLCIDTCGNGECDSWEDYTTCLDDCEAPECETSDDCDDSNPCTIDVCNASNKCKFNNGPDGLHEGTCLYSIGCTDDFGGSKVCVCSNGSCVDTCGDTLCQSYENYTNCEADCVKTNSWFSDGSTKKSVIFPEDGGSNDSVKVGIIQSATVINASVKLTGSAVEEDEFFESSISSEAITNPKQFTIGDFNNDGLKDAIVISDPEGSSDPFYFFEGREYEGEAVVDFKSGVKCKEADNALDINQGDFNEDGNLDIIIIQFSDENLAYFEGNGDGTFQDKKLIDVGQTMVKSEVGYFDEDSHLDIFLTSHQTTNGPYLLIGQGDGTFNGPIIYDSGVEQLDVLSGDFDNDGYSDLIVSDWNKDITVIKGSGFTFYPKIVTSHTITDETSGDFDDDGNLDLAAISFYFGDEEFYYYKGNGDGTFEEEVTVSLGFTPSAISAGDVNQDGKHELLISKNDSLSLKVLQLHPDGSIKDIKGYLGRKEVAMIKAEDLNEDNYPDVVMTSKDFESLTFKENIYGTEYYPKNPTLDIGSDMSKEWQWLEGDFGTSTTVEGFESELNNLITSCSCPGCSLPGDYCIFEFNMSSEHEGNITLSELSIDYYE